MTKVANWAKRSYGAARCAAICLVFAVTGSFSLIIAGQLSKLFTGHFLPPSPLHNLPMNGSDFIPAVMFAIVGIIYARRKGRFSTLLILLLALITVQGLFWTAADVVDTKLSPPAEVKWAHKKPPAKIITAYDSVEDEELPAVIPFNDAQREYMIELLSAALQVIERTSTLESQEAKIFGDGEFYWPKNPSQPIRSSRYYTEENFRVDGIMLSFGRKDQHSMWQNAGMSVQPRNFPRGMYDMRLPSSVFKEFKLLKSVQEVRPDASIHQPIVFYFIHRTIRDLTLKVETRSDSSGVNASYPRTFYYIEVTRGSVLETRL